MAPCPEHAWRCSDERVQADSAAPHASWEYRAPRSALLPTPEDHSEGRNVRSVLRTRETADIEEKKGYKSQGPDGHNALSGEQGAIVSRKQKARNGLAGFVWESAEIGLIRW